MTALSLGWSFRLINDIIEQKTSLKALFKPLFGYITQY